MDEAKSLRAGLQLADDQHAALIARCDNRRLSYRGAKLEDVHEFLLLHAAAAHPLADSITLCMTAYNEQVGAYHVSLDAMARNADYFARAGHPHVSQSLTICILVDGIDKMSASFAEHARKLGIFDPALLAADCDYHIFEATTERRLLHLSPEVRDSCAEPADTLVEFKQGKDSPEVANLQRIVLFIKQKNRGKLDSHRCFFEILCHPLKPAFFLQLDVGTCPQDGAVYQMWRRLKTDQNIAAVSARSHMPLPQGAMDLLGAWQYGDIASERILLWPTELLMGYMSVVSGQLCLTRSAAVWCDVPHLPDGMTGRQPVVTRAPPALPDDGSVVMKSYLRGLQTLGPFESNMFLAEDRILGLEIVFQPDSRWELGYVPEADALIDRCETWNELLCQRRRWTCSSVACRLWMFTRVADYVRSANRSLSQKARIVSASLFHSVYFLMQWLMPAFAVMIFTSLHNLAADTVSVSPLFRSIAHAGYGVVLCLLGAQLVVAWRGRLDVRTNRFFSASIAFQTFYTMATTAVIIAGNFTRPELMRPLLLLGTVLVALMVLSVWYAQEIFHGFTRSLLRYWFSRPAVAFLIMTYSALNSHNTSWGTKGLNRPHYLDGCARQQFDHFRLATVGAMLTANVLFYAYAVNHGWTRSYGGLEVVLGVVAAQTGFAFLARIVIELQSRWPRRIQSER